MSFAIIVYCVDLDFVAAAFLSPAGGTELEEGAHIRICIFNQLGLPGLRSQGDVGQIHVRKIFYSKTEPIKLRLQRLECVDNRGWKTLANSSYRLTAIGADVQHHRVGDLRLQLRYVVERDYTNIWRVSYRCCTLFGQKGF